MSKLPIVGASMLLLTTYLQAAEPASAPANFRIEVLVHKRAAGPVTIPVRCLNGCAWDVMTIDCPGEANECRAIIDGRSGIEPAAQGAESPEQLHPLSGTVCLGLAPGPTQVAQLGAAGVVIMEVQAGSPADLAGVKTGDILTSFNAVPVLKGKDLRGAVGGTVAGQVFEATLAREGTLVQISGHLGVLTTSHGCMPATASLLAIPAATPKTPSAVPFTIAFDDLESAELRCLEGCIWETSAPCPPKYRCSYTIDRDGSGSVSGVELKGEASNNALEQTRDR